MNARLSKFPYFALATALLSAGIALPIWVGRQAGAPLGWGTFALLTWTLIPLVAARLRRLGRSPDDLLWIIVPGLGQLFAATLMFTRDPSPDAEAKVRAKWEGRLGALAAARQGLGLVGRGALVVLPFTVLFAFLNTWALEDLKGFLTFTDQLARPAQEGLAQVFLIAAGLLGLYSLLNFTKRDRVSRATWIPSLFLVPLLLVWGTFFLLFSQGGGPGRNILLTMAVDLLFDMFGGAFLAILWIGLAEQLRAGGLKLGQLTRFALRRLGDVAGPHGGRTLGVQLGMQVLVPGIFYAIQLAFTDLVAVLEPDQPALSRSSKLTWGLRARVLKLLAVGVILSTPLQLLIIALFQGPEAIITYITFPGMVPPMVSFATTWVGLLAAAWVTLGLWALFRDTLAQSADAPTWLANPVDLDTLGPSSLGALRGLAAVVLLTGAALLAFTGAGYVMLGLGLVLLGASFARA